MLTNANVDEFDDYEVLFVFEGEVVNGNSTCSYVIRQRHTNKLALLKDCMYIDYETFTEEDFELCDPLIADYMRK